MIKLLIYLAIANVILHGQMYIIKDLKTQKNIDIYVKQDPSSSSINVSTSHPSSSAATIGLKDSRELIKIDKLNDYFISILFKAKTSWEQNDLIEAVFVVSNGKLVNALLLDRESGYSRKAPTTSGGISLNYLKYRNLLKIQFCSGVWAAEIQETWEEENTVDGKSGRKAWISNYILTFSDELSIFYNCIVSPENIKFFNNKVIKAATKEGLYLVFLRASQKSFDGRGWLQLNADE